MKIVPKFGDTTGQKNPPVQLGKGFKDTVGQKEVKAPKKEKVSEVIKNFQRYG